MEARFSAPVQTGPEAHPASCTMGTGSFPGVKQPGRGRALTSLPHLTSTPPSGLRGLFWGELNPYLYLTTGQFRFPTPYFSRFRFVRAYTLGSRLFLCWVQNSAALLIFVCTRVFQTFLYYLSTLVFVVFWCVVMRFKHVF